MRSAPAGSKLLLRRHLLQLYIFSYTAAGRKMREREIAEKKGRLALKQASKAD